MGEFKSSGKVKYFEDAITFLAIAIYLPVSLFFKQGLSLTIALFVIAGLLVLCREKHFAKPWLFFLLATFPLLGIGLSIFAFVPSCTLIPAIKFLALILAGYFVFLRAKKMPFRVKPLLYGLAVASALCLINILSEFHLFKFLGREGNLIKLMDQFALFLAISLWPIVYEFVQTKDMQYKIALLAATLIAIYIVFNLANHTAQYCLAVGGTTWIIALALRRRVLKILLSLSVIIVVMGMPWIVKNVLNINSISKDLPIRKGSFYHRLMVWQFVADQVVANPFKVRGFDIMRRKDCEQKGLEWSQEKKKILISKEIQKKNLFQIPHHPHNAALQAWQEFGIMGAILLSAFLLYGIYLINLLPTPLGRATGYSLFTTASFYFHASYGLWESKWWMILAIIFGLLCNLERNRMISFKH